MLLACAALTAISVASRIRRSHSWAIPRRDLCWSILLAILAIAMWLDQRCQASQLLYGHPDAAATWSIRLAN